VEQWLADVDGRAEPSSAGAADWFKKAVDTADRIEAAAYTPPWKLASTYALLAIAEAPLTQRTQKLTRTTAITNAAHSDGELLTVADVAAMTRLSVGTLRYWRHIGSGGRPRSSSPQPDIATRATAPHLLRWSCTCGRDH